jgi:hypothetical protein
MADNNNPNEKQPGEKPPGKYHYNPGNMSGKTIDIGQDESAREDEIDGDKGRDTPPHERSKA